MSETLPNNNGRERFELNLGGRSLGIAAKDLVTILLLLLLGVGGYLRYQALDKHFSSLDSHIMHIQDTLAVQAQNYRTLLITHDFNDCKDPADRIPLDLLPPGKKPQ